MTVFAFFFLFGCLAALGLLIPAFLEELSRWLRGQK